MSLSQQKSLLLTKPSIHYHVYKSSPKVPTLSTRIQSISQRPLYLRSILTFFPHTSPCFPKWFLVGPLNKIQHVFCISPIYSTYPVNLALLHFISLMSVNGNYNPPHHYSVFSSLPPQVPYSIQHHVFNLVFMPYDGKCILPHRNQVKSFHIF